MTKKQFLEDIKNGLIYTYYYTTFKGYEILKSDINKYASMLDKNKPIKQAKKEHINNIYNNVDIEDFKNYIILKFNDTQNITIYKKH